VRVGGGSARARSAGRCGTSVKRSRRCTGNPISEKGFDSRGYNAYGESARDDEPEKGQATDTLVEVVDTAEDQREGFEPEVEDGVYSTRSVSILYEVGYENNAHTKPR
jgi:hypothetical protein